jgi:hypothetical protein
VRKVKSLKIPIHFKEIIRRVRRADVSLESIGLDSEQTLMEFISTLADKLCVGTTFDSSPDNSSLFGTDAFKKLENCTVVALTLGQNIEAKLNELPDKDTKQIALIALLEFFEGSLKIVIDLISEEAIKENCILDTPYPLYKPFLKLNVQAENPENAEEFLEFPPLRFFKNSQETPDNNWENLNKTFEFLNVDKIGIKTENETVFPSLTTVFLVPWLAKKRKKK